VTTRYRRALALLEERTSVQFLVAFVLVSAVKWPTLFDPPVWDAAMGLFPAALTLAESNFDLISLLGQPSFSAGGPNVHSLSPVTLLTAAVLKGAGGGGPAAFVALHLIHFAIAAYALVVLFQFATPVFGRPSTALLCVAVLLFPLFSAQVGYMYFEVPLFLCAVSALRAWRDQRFWRAALWAAGALAVKQAGIIVPGALVLACALENHATALKLKRVSLVLAPSVLLLGVAALLDWIAGPPPGVITSMSIGDAFLSLLFYITHFIIKVPDLWALFVVFALFLPVSLGPLLAALRREPTPPANRTPEMRSRLVLAYSALVIMLFVGLFTVALPVVAGFTWLLPRYSVVVVPFLLVWLGHVAQRLGEGRRWPVPVCFAIVAVISAVNTNGVLYPSEIDADGPGNSPVMTERSNAYRRLMAVEMEAVRSLKDLPPTVPVYYGLQEHYLLTYPGLGYTDGPLANGHNLNSPSVTVATLTQRESMPPCFYALLTFPWLGGHKIRELLEYIETQDDLSSEIAREFRDGRYVMTLYRVQKQGALCPG